MPSLHAFCCPLSNLSSPTPSPAQPSSAWVSIRRSWQHSKLVHTLLSRPVDFAIYLLTLCPANSQRRTFLCVKSINHVRAAVPDRVHGLFFALPPMSALSNCPWALTTRPPVKRGATRVPLFQWPLLPHREPLSPYLDITEISLQLPLPIFQLPPRETSPV